MSGGGGGGGGMMGAVPGMIEGAGGAIAAKKQAKSQKKMAEAQQREARAMYEQSAAEREKYSQMAQAEGEIARDQLRSAEGARGILMGAMGAPGTYGPGATAATTKGPVGMSLLGPTGLTSMRKGGAYDPSTGRVTKSGTVRADPLHPYGATWKGKKHWEVTGNVADAQQTADAAMGTSGFRQVSQMVAESEQLLNREGPLWNEMQNSVVGGIYEGAAVAGRETAQALAREAARGGTNKSRAIAAAGRMRSQENINRDRTNQLWQSKMQMETWVRDNAKNVQNFAAGWAGNQAGIRDQFTTTMANLRTMWSTTMPAALMAAEGISSKINAEQMSESYKLLEKSSYNKNVAQTQAITSIFSSAAGGFMSGGK
jgi:hypothetical protein